MDEGSPPDAYHARIEVFPVRSQEFAILFKNWLTSKITKYAKTISPRSAFYAETHFGISSVPPWLFLFPSQTIRAGERNKGERGRLNISHCGGFLTLALHLFAIEIHLLLELGQIIAFQRALIKTQPAMFVDQAGHILLIVLRIESDHF